MKLIIIALLLYMKISFFVKIIFLFTFFAFTPILILSLILIKDYNHMKSESVSVMENGAGKLFDQSLLSLNSLGENIIKNQAIAVKKIVEIYLENHPDATAEELIANPDFQKIAIQPVGEKGYTTVILTKTENIIAHPNPRMMGKDLIDIKDKPEMKDWWKVVEVTWRDNVDNSGYYNWPEADGTYSRKYMYLAVIDSKLGGNIDLSVAATTYINEFNAPAELLKTQISEISKSMLDNLSNTSKEIQNKFYVILLLMSIIILFFGLFFAASITKPIKELKQFAIKIAKGKFRESSVKIKSNDEFSDLGECFNKMAKDLAIYEQELEKNNKELENRVIARTAELQQKNKELGDFNKMAVDRELKMIELKNKIEELKNKIEELTKKIEKI